MKLYWVLLLLIHVSFLFPADWGDWDINVLRKVNLERNISLDGLFIAITHSASPLAYGIPILLLVSSLYRRNKGIQKKALYIGLSVLLSAIIALIFKYGVNRVRPFLVYSFIQKVTDGGSTSFPSGHTCDAFALATAVSIAFQKWYVVVPFYLWAFAVGYSRIDLGVHYPSDVFGGIIIGSASAIVGKLIIKCFCESK
jgi:undecaprenyl-diphosphatase